MTSYLVFIYPSIYLWVLMFEPKHPWLCWRISKNMYTNVLKEMLSQGRRCLKDHLFWKCFNYKSKQNCNLYSNHSFLHKTLFSFLSHSNSFSCLLIAKFTQVWHFVVLITSVSNSFYLKQMISCEWGDGWVWEWVGMCWTNSLHYWPIWMLMNCFTTCWWISSFQLALIC